MIDARKIRAFWDERGKRFERVIAEMANLEPDPGLQAMKSRLEREMILPRLNLNPEMRILDLGAGYGQWAILMAPFVKEVCAVEYSRSMLEAGRKEVLEKGLANITFINSAAEDFLVDEEWDLVFISGLLLYLDDEQARAVGRNVAGMVGAGKRVFLREAVSLLPSRYIIDSEWSDALASQYSALYRREEEIMKLFKPLSLIDKGYMFPDGSPLNKWKETRLKFFIFEKMVNA